MSVVYKIGDLFDNRSCCLHLYVHASHLTLSLGETLNSETQRKNTNSKTKGTIINLIR